MFDVLLNPKAGRWIFVLGMIVVGGVGFRLYSSGHGGLQVSAIHPLEGNVWSAALSPDGSQVAMMRRVGIDIPNGLHEAIEVKDVASDKEAASFSLPPRDWKSARQTYVDRQLQYCDNGKYLLAYTGPDALMALTTSDYTVHSVITLGTLAPQLSANQATLWMTYMPLSDKIVVQCSAQTPLVVLGSWGDMQASSIRVFDLEKGVETVDLSRAFAARYQGGGVAISPNGRLVAGVTWSNQKHGLQAEVVEASRESGPRALFLGQKKEILPTYLVAFAGNDAVLTAEKSCDDGDSFCDFKPHRRVIEDWAFAKDGAPKEIGRLGAETYRYLSSSADGQVAFGYSGVESYCETCNSRLGETKISDARFLIWDRASGRRIAESPMLDVEKHSCTFTIAMGSCTAFERVPEMQMSENGKAVLAYIPLSSDDPPDRNPRPLTVFRLP